MREDPRLYDIARDVSHQFGFDWVDPRNGKTHPVRLSKWWKTPSARAAMKRAKKVKQERLKTLRKLAAKKKGNNSNGSKH